MIKNTEEYKLIKHFYGDHVAQRSQVPLMNHIDEGLVILNKIGATTQTKKAFCIHPMFQDFKSLSSHLSLFHSKDPVVMALTIEYRSKANSYLCKPKNDGLHSANLSDIVGELLPEVRDMLIADKVQNMKDFMRYHYGTHPRSFQLQQYFNIWFDYLDCRDIYDWFSGEYCEG